MRGGRGDGAEGVAAEAAEGVVETEGVEDAVRETVAGVAVGG